MTGSRASASADAAPGAAAVRRVLVCSVNWIGDAIMAMPAVQRWRERHPGDRLVVLARPPVDALWRLHAAPDEVWPMPRRARAVAAAAGRARRARFDEAVILPNSPRSALVPWLAGIPRRVGLRRGARDLLLTSAVRPPAGPGREHQAWEYVALLCPEAADRPLPAPRLALPPDARRAAEALLEGLPRPRVALMPGAARGPSKRWPDDHFARVARDLSAAPGCGIVALGAASERDACARSLPPAGRNLAGRTDLAAWAAVLAACDLAVSNDSGGAHLAAAVGTPVVVVFGATDPARTAPLGPGVDAVAADVPRRGRDIARSDARAAAALRALEPGRVVERARARLARGRPAAGERDA